MERLTYKSSFGDYGSAKDFPTEHDEIIALRNKLGAYEDAEEQEEYTAEYDITKEGNCLMVCSPNNGKLFLKRDKKCADALVITRLLRDGDVVIVPRKEFMEYLDKKTHKLFHREVKDEDKE